jgi:sporulation protein YlmC with PRC-barrel domain
MYLANMTILNGVASESGRAPDVELNIYKNDKDELEVIEFISRDGSGLGNNPQILIPVAEIDNVIAMLQQVKAQQSA